MDEFAETMALKKQMKQEEDARNSKILATMSKMLQDEELQDIQKREKQVFWFLYFQDSHFSNY